MTIVWDVPFPFKNVSSLEKIGKYHLCVKQTRLCAFVHRSNGLQNLVEAYPTTTKRKCIYKRSGRDFTPESQKVLMRFKPFFFFLLQITIPFWLVVATVGCIIQSRMMDDPPLSAHVRRGTLQPPAMLTNLFVQNFFSIKI